MQQKKHDQIAIHEKVQMHTEKRGRLNPGSMPARVACASVFFYLWFLLTSCGGNTPTISTPALPSIYPTETAFSSVPMLTTVTMSCIDGLVFLEDATIPDNSIIPPGFRLDKQWLVQNSGSCNWDSRYRLRMIGGNALGASLDQALFPARAGMQATLEINFTAPLEAGEYFSEWQAFDANGIPFGESFFIKIIVQ